MTIGATTYEITEFSSPFDSRIFAVSSLDGYYIPLD